MAQNLRFSFVGLILVSSCGLISLLTMDWSGADSPQVSAGIRGKQDELSQAIEGYLSQQPSIFSSYRPPASPVAIRALRTIAALGQSRPKLANLVANSYELSKGERAQLVSKMAITWQGMRAIYWAAVDESSQQRSQGCAVILSLVEKDRADLLTQEESALVGFLVQSTLNAYESKDLGQSESQEAAFRLDCQGYLQELGEDLPSELDFHAGDIGWGDQRPQAEFAAFEVSFAKFTELPQTPEEAIKSVLIQQVEAWNAGDIDGFMQTYWKSEDLTFSSGGQTTRGWQATIDRYKSRYSSRELMGRLSFSNLEVTMLAEDAALVLGRWKLERDEPIGGNFTLIFRKLDDAWVIIHDHSSAEEPDLE